tara:strand:- start:814 stop:1530 length:717 start_codon:yes stop_codon:yes gene_type:complete
MSAIHIAEKAFTNIPIPKEFLELMVRKFPDLPPVKELMEDSEIQGFVSSSIKKKRKSPTIEERRGKYDEVKCDARIWKTMKGTKRGYDDIQCSSKKIKGQCMCKKHLALQKEGKLWLGLITEKRPENPVGPPGSTEPREHQWATDEKGNLIVEEEEEEEEVVSYGNYSTEYLMKLIAEKEKERKDDVSDSENGDDYEVITFEGTEYKMVKEDKVVLSLDNSKIVGKWDTNKSIIVFDE